MDSTLLLVALTASVLVALLACRTSSTFRLGVAALLFVPAVVLPLLAGLSCKLVAVQLVRLATALCSLAVRTTHWLGEFAAARALDAPDLDARNDS